MSTINLKAVKRRRKLAGRVKHHGTTYNCFDAHIDPGRVPRNVMKLRDIFFLGRKAAPTPSYAHAPMKVTGTDFFRGPEKVVGFRQKLTNRWKKLWNS